MLPEGFDPSICRVYYHPKCSDETGERKSNNEEILTLAFPKNVIFEGVSSLIFRVFFRLAIFKVSFFIFCNLQPPLLKNRFERHE